MRIQLLELDPRTYRAHALHGTERLWAETNCYVDLWIEMLHALGMEPAAVGSSALASDFLGDQWTFFKCPPEDLRALYGIEVGELAVWRPLIEHVVEYLGRGQLLTVEVDAWHLPDTAGVSYRLDHVKTTIVPQMVDPDLRRLGYFHNAGYHELEGDDFEALFGPASGEPLPPYVELVRSCNGGGLGDARSVPPALLTARARALAVDHLARRPPTNPVKRFAARLEEDLAWLPRAGMEAFHGYAFATCRQCGAAAEVAAGFVSWLEAAELAPGSGEAGVPAREAVAAQLDLAAGAKTLQFQLARAAAGRRADPYGVLEQMADAWDRASAALAECYAR